MAVMETNQLFKTQIAQKKHQLTKEEIEKLKRISLEILLDVIAVCEDLEIPYMLGATSQDMMPFFIFPMAKDFCDKQKKAYCWFFDRQLPGDDNGAWHSSDLWYWFGTLKNGWRPFEEKDYAISDAMSSYLCNFAKTGDPNGDGLVEWEQAKPGKNKVIRIGEGNIRMASVSKAKLLWTTLTNKNVGE